MGTLPHSAREGLAARQNESEAILSRLHSDDFVILLDEIGEPLTSPALATILDTAFGKSRRIVMLIGGAYGVNDDVHQRADLVWSLSPLVFPHQLVRLIVIEQLYRAQEINSGRPYHHV